MMTKTLTRLFSPFLLIFMLAGCGYNDIQTYDEQTNSAWSEVLNQYQRRADLIPNLVASVKGYATHEKEVLEAVTLARARANTATQNLKSSPEDEQLQQQWQQSQVQVTRALVPMMQLGERYPELKSQALFQNLMVQLEGTENRIAVARGRYIKAIELYNITVRQFPAAMTAKMMGYKPKKNYLPDDVESITKAPSIDFSSK